MSAVEITFDESSRNEFTASVIEISEKQFTQEYKLPATNTPGRHRYYAIVIARSGTANGERAISADMIFTYTNGATRSETAFLSLMKGESQLELVKLSWGMDEMADLKQLEMRNLHYK